MPSSRDPQAGATTSPGYYFDIIRTFHQLVMLEVWEVFVLCRSTS